MKVLNLAISALLIPGLIAIPVCAESADGPDAALQLTATVQGNAISILVVDETGAPVTDAAVVVRLPDTGETGVFTDGTHAAVAYTDLSGEARIEGLKWGSGGDSIPIKVTATKGSTRAGMLLERKASSELVSAEAVASPPKPAAPVPVKVAALPITKPVARMEPAPSVPEPGQVKDSSTQAAIAAPPAAPPEPMVTITHGPTHEKISGGSHKKWIILAAVAGAGAGAAFALGGKKSSSSSSSSTATTTIGTPTITVGAP